MFCSVDAESFEILKCNRTMAAALGRSKEALVGTSVVALTAPDARPAMRQALAAIPDDGTSRFRSMCSGAGGTTV